MAAAKLQGVEHLNGLQLEDVQLKQFNTTASISLPETVYKKSCETYTILDLESVKKMKVSVNMFVTKTIYWFFKMDLNEVVSLHFTWKKSMLYQVTTVHCYLGDCQPCCLWICQPIAALGLMSTAALGLLGLAALLFSHTALGLISFATNEELSCPEKGFASLAAQIEDDISLAAHREEISALLPRRGRYQLGCPEEISLASPEEDFKLCQPHQEECQA